MEVLGYLASALIGISLGLIGGGGSILTVPVLVYLFGLAPLQATSYSLFVVGTTSLLGAVENMRKGLVNFKSVLFFGSASVLTVFLTRKWLIPIIPAQLVSFGGFHLTSSFLTMTLFSILMLTASLSMIRDKVIAEKECTDCVRFLKLVGYGVLIGLVTGLLGAGGGFLLIPALVFFVKLPMKNAIGTSLMIIAINSLFGFMADLGHFRVNWPFLLTVTVIATGGIIIGSLLSHKVGGASLKKGFGWFVLSMGIYILFRELSHNGLV